VDVGSPEAGFFRNAATKQCLNVAGCSNPVIFDGCSAAPTQTCGGAGLKGQPNEQFTLNGTRVLSALQPVPDGDRQRRPGEAGTVRHHRPAQPALDVRPGWAAQAG
jgi:hypothetical protein